MQGELLREGLWGEQVQGEGGAAAGSCVLQGFAKGQGPGRGGPGSCVLQGLAEGQGWGRQPRRPQGAGPGEARQPRRGGCRPVPHPPQACP